MTINEKMTALADKVRRVTRKSDNEKLSIDGMTSALASVNVDFMKSIIERTVTEITAEDLAGVEEIGESALKNCKALTKVTLSDTVLYIRGSALDWCENLSEIVFNNNLIVIEGWAFSATGVERITLPNSVRWVGTGAFYSCANLKSVVWSNYWDPLNYPHVWDQTFVNCTSLEYIDFSHCNHIIPLFNVDVFYGVPKTCKFYVPANLLDSWKSESNWSNFAEQIMVKPSFYLSDYDSMFGPYQFVEGMTWREFVESDYCAQITNDGIGIRIGADGAVEIALDGNAYFEIVCNSHGPQSDKADDLIENEQTYYDKT